MAKVSIATVNALILEHHGELMNVIKELRNEVASLKTEIASMKSQKDTGPPASYADAVMTSMETIVKSSVETVLYEEKTRNDVIVIGLPENTNTDDSNDNDELAKLCTTIECKTKPVDVVRLGKKGKSNRPRLLKLTFPSSFDARAFRSKFSECSKSTSSPFKSLKCRPGRTKAEQMKQKKLSDLAYDLNKKSNDTTSFSVRESGELWKFIKNSSGKWTRDSDWIAPEIPSGNEPAPETPSGNQPAPEIPSGNDQ